MDNKSLTIFVIFLWGCVCWMGVVEIDSLRNRHYKKIMENKRNILYLENQYQNHKHRYHDGYIIE